MYLPGSRWKSLVQTSYLCLKERLRGQSMILMRNPAKFIILCALDSLKNHEKNISLWRKRQLLYTGPLPFEIFSLSHLSCSLYLKFQISWYEMRSSLGKVGYVWYSPGFTLTSEIFSVFWRMFVVYGNLAYKLLSWCGQTNNTTSPA